MLREQTNKITDAPSVTYLIVRLLSEAERNYDFFMYF